MVVVVMAGLLVPILNGALFGGPTRGEFLSRVRGLGPPTERADGFGETRRRLRFREFGDVKFTLSLLKLIGLCMTI